MRDEEQLGGFWLAVLGWWKLWKLCTDGCSRAPSWIPSCVSVLNLCIILSTFSLNVRKPQSIVALYPSGVLSTVLVSNIGAVVFVWKGLAFLLICKCVNLYFLMPLLECIISVALRCDDFLFFFFLWSCSLFFFLEKMTPVNDCVNGVCVGECFCVWFGLCK